MSPSHSLHKITAVSLCLCAASFLLYGMAKWVPGFADFYSSHIYRVTAGLFSRFFSLLPFSAAELLLYVLLAAFAAGILLLLVRICRRRQKARQALFRFGSRFFLVVSALLFIYTANCGVNYYRTDFSTLSGLHKSKYTIKDLIDYCAFLTRQLTALEPRIETDENGLCLAQRSCYREGADAMKRLGELYPSLSGYYPKAKPVLVSQILSYQQLCGVYSPFTVEANINDDMPGFYLPMAVCHELSHLKGFMQEEEANYIGCLACMSSDNAYFQYSGYLVAWLYAMEELHAYNPFAYARLVNSLCDTAIRDLNANSAFWNAHEGKIAEVSSKMNDAYLKANAQPDGILSYDRVVSLLLSDYLEKRN